ncbi:hypothetical protein COU60_00135 [Candidatus Pacearchaeota archaeon CG10_big_fil_rev_8_21_14_0_10_34_76]|nr:MAG: hypothetical protein COU60_00135 [Candidatus Pacearchaeota archaeon CG10_big_fil_rev_8_21_14_0_10_34_76]
MTRHYQKKITLGVYGRQTKWAPVWAVVKKFGQGKAKGTHPSQITKVRRSWNRTKLKIKPRRTRKKQLG